VRRAEELDYVFIHDRGSQRAKGIRGDARLGLVCQGMRPEDRATLLAWLAISFDDQVELYPPAQNRRRDKATIAGRDYWLLNVPSK